MVDTLFIHTVARACVITHSEASRQCLSSVELLPIRAKLMIACVNELTLRRVQDGEGRQGKNPQAKQGRARRRRRRRRRRRGRRRRQSGVTRRQERGRQEERRRGRRMVASFLLQKLRGAEKKADVHQKADEESLRRRRGRGLLLCDTHVDTFSLNLMARPRGNTRFSLVVNGVKQSS